MQPDYRQLLSSLAAGEEPDLAGLLKKKKSGPEPKLALPSHTAAVDAVTSIASPPMSQISSTAQDIPLMSGMMNESGAGPVMGAAAGASGMSSAMGVAGGIAGGLNGGVVDTKGSVPIAPAGDMSDPQRETAIANAIGQGTRPYYNGGEIPPNTPAVVGQEVVVAPAGAHVIPARDVMASQHGVDGDGNDSEGPGDIDAQPHPAMAQPNMSQISSQTRQPETEDQLQARVNALYDPNAPAQKHGFWGKLANVAFKAGQVVDNSIQGVQKPVQSIDEVARDAKARPIMRQIGLLKEQRAQQQAAEAAAAANEYKRSQAAELDARGKKQLADIEHQQKVDALAGKKWDKLIQNGLIFKKNADGTLEPLIDPTTGKQAEDLLNKPMKVTSAGGKEVYATGKDIYTADATAANAEANRKQQDEHFKAGQALDEKKFQQAQLEFQRVQGLREAAEKSGNAKAKTDLDAKLTDMAAKAATALQKGELTTEQYNALMASIQTQFQNNRPQ